MSVLAGAGNWFALLCIWLVGHVLISANNASAQTGLPLCEQETAGAYSSELVPGVGWKAFRILLGRNWSERERRLPGWFDREAATRAATQSPLDAEFKHFDGREYRDTLDVALVDETDTADYQTARQAFYERDWHKAIALFDAIAARAILNANVARYSAARAALNAGDFLDGIARIGDLTGRDGSKRVQLAAHHLLGTFANDTGAAPLVAAHLSQIAYLLRAPGDLRCSDPTLRQLTREADDDLFHILSIAFASDSHEFTEWSPRTQRILERLAQNEPLIDVTIALARPSPFSTSYWIEPFLPYGVESSGAQGMGQGTLDPANPEPKRHDSHARERARATKNPLWVLAVARQTTDLDDLDMIREARSGLMAYPIPEADRRALGAWLFAHELRILILAGRPGQALGELSQSAGALDTEPPGYGSPSDFVSHGAVRSLLARRDLDDARAWANATFLSVGHAPGYENFDVVLSSTWTEALGLDDPDGGAYIVSNDIASGLDLLSADQLVAFARSARIRAEWRRPLMSAAWIRYYALGRDRQFLRLVPEIIAAFPELTKQLRRIEAAWLPSRRRHLITHLLLQLPGLSPRVLWARKRSAYPDVFSFDSYNHNDGNWWCALEPSRSLRDAFNLIIAARLSQPLMDRFWQQRHLVNDRRTPDSLASDWIKWHPLFEGADFDQLRNLERISSGPERLAREALDWARGSTLLSRALGLDDELPETLALAVRATHYGCRREPGIGATSKAAWRVLHESYPTSDWAKRTRYWFDEYKQVREEHPDWFPPASSP